MGFNLKTFGTRAFSAVFFVIILVSCIYFSYLTFLLLFFIVALLALYEYYLIAKKLNAAPYPSIGYLFSILLFIYFSSDILQQYISLDLTLMKKIAGSLLLLLPSLVLIKGLFSASSNNLLNIQHTVLGVLYAAFPLALLISLPIKFGECGLQYDYFKVLGIIFLIWTNDTFAYLGGSFFGKNKMYERISPGKTWEGTIIGAACTIAVGFLLNLNGTYSHDFVWPFIALLVAVFGTIGDLVESMLKRQAGVKDSGQIMPGHGGALDRFDSLIFVTPFVYTFLKIFVD